LITFTEEPYDGPVVTELVPELLAELNLRYPRCFERSLTP
jgi:hypothetical protein